MIEKTLICDLYIKYCVFGCMNCVLFAGFFLSGANSSFRERGRGAEIIHQGNK